MVLWLEKLIQNISHRLVPTYMWDTVLCECVGGWMKNEAVFDFPGPQSSVSGCRKYGSLTEMEWNENVVTWQSFVKI
jgi:hypothetical protein